MVRSTLRGGGVRISCALSLDPPLEFGHSERGTLGRMGCTNQQSKRTKERGRGQDIVTTVANSGPRPPREHVLACLPRMIGLLLFYPLLSRFNATFLHRRLLPDQTFRNFPFCLSQEHYLRIPEFLACS